MPTTYTTTLPDEDQPVLGNGVEDEVAVDREDAPTNYGEVRLQIRETKADSWDSDATGFDETTVAYDTLTYDFTGREDGEEYEVRARSLTDHRTGAWTDPVSIVTLFPGSDNLSATAVDQTTVDLDWDENSNNESGQLVLREEKFDGGFGSLVELDDAGPNTGSFTDDTALPDRTYRYRIEAYTDDASGQSNTVTATTDGDDAPSGNVPASGWYARVYVDDRVVEPSIVGDAEWVPKLNALPEAVLPVENAERYERDAYDDARVDVWKDGVRLPIDEIAEVDVETGGEGELTVRGGTQLKRLVNPEYDNKAVSVAADELIEDTTDYVANADEVDTETSGGVQQQAVDDSADWTNALEETVDDSDIHEISDGALQSRQVAYAVPATDDNTIRGEEKFEPADEYQRVDGRYYVFNDTTKNNLASGIDVNVEVDHTIPADAVELWVRWEFRTPDPDDSDTDPPSQDALHHGFEVRVDNDVLEDVDPDVFNYDEETVEWDTFSGPSQDVEPGTVNLRIAFDEESSDPDAEVAIDAIGIIDERHSNGFGDVVENSTRPLDVDTLYAEGVEVETGDVTAVEQVVGGEIEATIDDTGGQQAMALSNDGGSSWPVSANNTDTVSGSFPESTNTIRVRFTLGSYDDGSEELLVGGVAPQRVDAYDLFTDLENTPTLVNRTFNGDLRDVLTEIAEFGGFVWEVRRDGGTYSVEFTRPGARDGRIPNDVETDFEIDRDTGEIIDAAEVTGGASPRNGERFQSDTSEVVIDLSRSRIVDGSEQVYDADTGTVFEANDDYEMSYNDGGIVTLSDGDMTDNTEYRIDYQFKPYGEYESGTYDGNTERKVVETFPNVVDELTAQSSALRLVSSNSSPAIDATLRLSGVDPDLSLVEALEPANDAFRGRSFEVRELDSMPGGAVLHLSAGDTIEESITELRRRLEPVEKRA